MSNRRKMPDQSLPGNPGIGSQREFPMSPRATRFATESELVACLRQPSEIVEWPIFGHVFAAHSATNTIARLDGPMGGDTRPSVFYAWHYDNPFSFMLDWNEIKSVPEMEPGIRRRMQQ